MTRKIETKTYEIMDQHISDEQKIALFSDLHYVTYFDKKLINNIINNIALQNPNCICVCGDTIDSTKELENKKNYDYLLAMFKELGQISETFVSLGSHDFIKYLKNGRKIGSNEQWLNDLNNLKNVNLLHNSNYEFNKINFIGYTQPWQYYYSKSVNGKYVDSEEVLIDDLNNYLPSLVKDDKCNILLCHSPIKILEDEVINNVDKLKEIRLILSGHMHNGMVPPILDKIIKGNKGIIYPEKQLFPKLARGIYNKNITEEELISIIISGGITKIHDCSPKILHPLNNVFPASIEYIKVKRKVI